MICQSVKYYQKGTRHAIRLPLSKSIANRSLVISFLAGSLTTYTEAWLPNDVIVMQTNLLKLNSSVHPSGSTILHCGEAGTVARFVMALLASVKGHYVLTAGPRMSERPMQPLVDALVKLGATIRSDAAGGGFPYTIEGHPLPGGPLGLKSDISSQFISALLMIGPLMHNGLTIELEGKPVSEPYIAMTIGLMREAGAAVTTKGHVIRVEPGGYTSGLLRHDRDWSAAAPWFEFAALVPDVELELTGLVASGLQGDQALCQLFNPLGVNAEEGNGSVLLKSHSNRGALPPVADFSDYPDLAQCYLATLTGLNISQKITGLKTLRWKETDRIEAMIHNLRLMGATLRVTNYDEVVCTGHRGLAPTRLTMFNDHRMALSLLPLAAVANGLVIDDVGVISKSYPAFARHLRQVGFVFEDA